MTQDELLLVVAALVAGFTFRLALRLAPPLSEFPLKTLAAGLLSAVVGLAGVLPYRVDEPLRLAMLVLGPLYAFGPLAAVGLAKLRRYRLAGLLLDLLFWTHYGRLAARRLPAQAALQQGDGAQALELVPSEDGLMSAQALALAGQWHRVVELDLPRRGEPGYLGDSLRIEALLRLGREDEARRVLDGMRERWPDGPQGPLGYRSLRLSEARLAAEAGDLAALRGLFEQPLPGVPAHLVLGLLARGAERAGAQEKAVPLYREAYTVAPGALRERYAERLRELGSAAPPITARPRSPVATWTLAAVLALAYLAQLWLDGNAGPFATSAGGFKASSLAGAFLVGLPALPAAEAWWRYLSYAFVHGNLIHIGFNIWVLLDIGRMLEARRGWRDLVISFAAGAACGALLTEFVSGAAIFAPVQPSGAMPQVAPLVLVGASGGVLGVAGSLLARAWASGNAADRSLAGGLVRWMVLIVLLSLAIPNVSLWGHVGGVAGGMLWGLLRPGRTAVGAVDTMAAGGALILLLLAVAGAAGLALRLAAL